MWWHRRTKMSFTMQDILIDIENKFQYHAPTPEQVIIYNKLRLAFKELALMILDVTPICPDQTIALRKLHECSMATNSVIACNTKGETK
jgi:hypothetical protein